MDYQKLANLLKVVAEPNRLKILEMLSCGEMCACNILDHFDFTQPTLSHHMKILCDAEIVVGRKEGKWTHYSISEKGVKQAKECLEQLTTLDVEYKNKSCCEK